ncbi:TusE/DsrC/DsvC family sulfur relay protein [Candidatus Saccharibacteria bacterium]|nr:TusE/DsrC/DsvC family sulfur relay protein [Candidatus Saccharibacteria bacterium]MCB9821071.1 TusE/DsrC/DsvC family sulfur relay protein [Candidatus Nomurabacteria bacterium]
MQKEIAGQNVEVDAEGYLADLNQWNGEIAKAIASELGITELSQQHWDVINWLRDQKASGNELNIRKVGGSGVVDIKQFYQLFPGGPLKNASKIAGLPKPTSCL